MSTRSSPTVKRRRLAGELRQLREAAGLTIEEVAARLEWSNAKISRIENARVSVLPRDVKFLLGVYDIAGDQRDFLLALARDSRQKGWWHAHGEAIPEWFAVYVGLESEATSLRMYESEFVPGQLQTEDYARAVYTASLMTEPDEVDKRVALRLARQERLTIQDTLQLWVVINEAVIRRIIGGPQTMQAQLNSLADAAQLPNVTLQVLPFSAGAHPAMTGAFHILGFPERADSDVVYVEYHTGTLYLEKTAEVERYSVMYDRLRAAALHPEDSRALIARAANELSRQTEP